MSTFQGGPPNIVTNGLVLYLDAANRESYVSGSTTWRDLSGTRNNGTLVNGVGFSENSAGSLVFDGINDLINHTRVVMSTGLTYNAWIITTSTKSTKTYTGNAAINVIGDTTGQVWNGFGVTDGKVNYNNARKNASWAQYTSSISVNTGNWNYITVTHNTNETVNLYVNGTLDSTFNNTSTGGFNIWVYTAFNIIGKGYSSGDYFTGSIANVSIYNRALSATEVLQNYNSTKARFGL